MRRTGLGYCQSADARVRWRPDSDRGGKVGRFGRGSLIAAAFALVLALEPAITLANHTAVCSDYGFVKRFHGRVSDPWSDHRYGVRAYFSNLTFEQCTQPRPGEASSSVAWVGIQGPTNATMDKNIVQALVGRCRHDTGCTGALLEGYSYGRDQDSPGCAGIPDVAPTGHWLGPSVGNGLFSVVENANNTFTIDTPNTYVTLTSGTICWYNQYVAQVGETWDFGDAMGGTTALHFTFSDQELRTTPGGAWVPFGGYCTTHYVTTPLTPLESVFKCTGNGGSMDLWTAR